MLFKLGNILKVLLSQFLLLMVIFIVVLLKYGLFVSVSIFYGGLTSILSSSLFIIIFTFKSVNNTPKHIVKKFYLAGMLKIITLILTCILIFNLAAVHPIGYFISLIFIQLTFWCSCLFFFNEDTGSHECR